jgi:hypothetical protein
MPQWLTRWESLSCARPKWPASNRNGGQLRLVTVAGFASEYPAGLNRKSAIIAVVDLQEALQKIAGRLLGLVEFPGPGSEQDQEPAWQRLHQTTAKQSLIHKTLGIHRLRSVGLGN